MIESASEFAFLSGYANIPDDQGDHAQNAEHRPEPVPVLADQQELRLAYRIEGAPDDVDVFELSEILQGLGSMIADGYKAVHPPQGEEVVVRVKPFKEGSFWMDLVLSIQQSPAALLFIAHAQAIFQIRQVLEHLGLISKGAAAVKTVLELIKFLKGESPAKVEQTGSNEFQYQNRESETMNVVPQVHTLINHGTVQNHYYFALGLPAEREGVSSVRTFLVDEPNTTVEITRDDAPALRAYTLRQTKEPPEEVNEHIITDFLHPKAGTYGETSGTWTFRKAGTNRTLKAKILDKTFLVKYSKGTIRFYHGDMLKVRLREIQRIKGTTATTENEILEVLEYRKGSPTSLEKKAAKN